MKQKKYHKKINETLDTLLSKFSNKKFSRTNKLSISEFYSNKTIWFRSSIKSLKEPRLDIAYHPKQSYEDGTRDNIQILSYNPTEAKEIKKTLYELGLEPHIKIRDFYSNAEIRTYFE